MIYIPSLVSFGVYSGSEKCDNLGRERCNSKNNSEHVKFGPDRNVEAVPL